MTSKTDMPARIWVDCEPTTYGSSAEMAGIWDTASTSSDTPYIRTDLVQEAVEVLETARAWMIPGMNWTDETGAQVKDDADAALSKLKEAGL